MLDTMRGYLIGISYLKVGDGINDAPSLALADVGIALQVEGQETAASNAASIILLGNRLSQVHVPCYHIHPKIKQKVFLVITIRLFIIVFIQKIFNNLYILALP